ncbi:MAG TPA: hypothetical protein VEK07_10430 [Polyangiaceae bacterium]|nr:hypothetical protein [Polyangiaceae bacterium]
MNVPGAAKLLVGSVLVYGVAAGVPIGATFRADLAGGDASGALRFARADAERGGRRLRATYLKGDDGSREVVGWFDAALEVDCSFAAAADGAWRCLPGGAEAGRFFADAACTQRLATLPRGCSSPAYAVLNDTSACASRPTKHVFSLGARYTGPIAYSFLAGACSAVTSADLVLVDLYLVEEEASPGSFVGATLEREP